MKKFKDGEFPKKGEIFGIKVDSIHKIGITKNDKSDFGYGFYSSHEVYEKIKDKYLLFMYLGDGLAREKSTSIIFNIIDLKESIYWSDCINYIEFNDKYKRFLKNPLLIPVDDKTTLYKIDKDYKNLLEKTDKEEKMISSTITKANAQAKKSLLYKFDILKKEAYKEALNEDAVYNLKKTINK